MTHVLIAADLFTLGIGFVVLIVVLILVGAASSGQIAPLRTYRRRSRPGFWHGAEPNYPPFGQDGLLDDVHEIATQTFSESPTDLTIYQAHDNSSHSTHTDSSGSILGLDGGTASGSLEHSDEYGALGASVGESLNLDSSGGGGYTDFSDSSSTYDNPSDWSSGGSFGDSGSSFSDNSGGGSFSNDN
jgi:hypothetical protein